MHRFSPDGLASGMFAAGGLQRSANAVVYSGRTSFGHAISHIKLRPCCRRHPASQLNSVNDGQRASSCANQYGDLCFHGN